MEDMLLRCVSFPSFLPVVAREQSQGSGSPASLWSLSLALATHRVRSPSAKRFESLSSASLDSHGFAVDRGACHSRKPLGSAGGHPMSASGLLGLLVNVSAGPELQGLLSITLESLQVLSHEVALLRKENFELSQQINLLDYNLAGEELAPPPPEPADTKRAQNVTQCQTRAAEVAQRLNLRVVSWEEHMEGSTILQEDEEPAGSPKLKNRPSRRRSSSMFLRGKVGGESEGSLFQAPPSKDEGKGGKAARGSPSPLRQLFTAAPEVTVVGPGGLRRAHSSVLCLLRHQRLLAHA